MKSEEEYELESAVDTLMRAEEIKADKELMAKLEPYLKKKTKALRSLKDLRKLYSEKLEEDDDRDQDKNYFEDRPDFNGGKRAGRRRESEMKVY